jgi:hypothetical protein
MDDSNEDVVRLSRPLANVAKAMEFFAVAAFIGAIVTGIVLATHTTTTLSDPNDPLSDTITNLRSSALVSEWQLAAP